MSSCGPGRLCSVTEDGGDFRGAPAGLQKQDTARLRASCVQTVALSEPYVTL